MISILRRYCSGLAKFDNVKSILKDKPLEKRVSLKGWAKAVRRQKELTFVDFNDGSSIQNLQVVVSSTEKPSSLGFHSSLYVSGILRKSSHKKQDLELLADDIQVIGEQHLDDYPFKARVKSTPDHVRQYQHLRARTNFSALLRVRSQAKLAIHEYFSKKEFINIDTPILTSNDCEGAGEVFTVETLPGNKESDLSTDKKFFTNPVFLTVSGQLHLEAMASGLSKVYNFSPAFRAENAMTRRHLSEFWMVEAEEAFLSGSDGFEALKEQIESLIKFTTQHVLDKNEADISHFWKVNEETEKLVQNALQKPFANLSYNEAMTILLANSNKFKIPPVAGEDLAREHELFLISHLGDIPLFVTDWPTPTKSFYMCSKEDDPNLVYGLDLLFPNVGEMVGGGLREHRSSVLEERLRQKNILKSLGWYMDLRKYNGRAPSGGFGLGFERYLLFLLGISNIKDTIPFPRWSRHCSC